MQPVLLTGDGWTDFCDQWKLESELRTSLREVLCWHSNGRLLAVSATDAAKQGTEGGLSAHQGLPRERGGHSWPSGYARHVRRNQGRAPYGISICMACIEPTTLLTNSPYETWGAL